MRARPFLAGLGPHTFRAWSVDGISHRKVERDVGDQPPEERVVVVVQPVVHLLSSLGVERK